MLIPGEEEGQIWEKLDSNPHVCALLIYFVLALRRDLLNDHFAMLLSKQYEAFLPTKSMKSHSFFKIIVHFQLIVTKKTKNQIADLPNHTSGNVIF